MTTNKLKTILIAGAVSMALSAVGVQAAGPGGAGGGSGGPGGAGGGTGGGGTGGGGTGGGGGMGGGDTGGGDMGKGNICRGVPGYTDLKAALDLAVTQDTSNLNLGMWATVVNRDGFVCAVAFSGADRNAQWPASRVISAQKANTANSLSLDGLALSTANLYSAVQGTSSISPLGGSLYGLQFSNPVDPVVAYRGKPTDYGTVKDPMINGRIGGVNVFGGGLGLYDGKSHVIGGVGVSGDTSCRDHMVAWHIRHNLKLDNMKHVGGVAGDPKHPDNILFSTTGSTTGWEHPDCGPGTTDPATLPPVI